ncbi:MAG: hypothetical protein AB8I08_11790 [Sandaracinaceae bacterium]
MTQRRTARILLAIAALGTTGCQSREAGYRAWCDAPVECENCPSDGPQRLGALHRHVEDEVSNDAVLFQLRTLLVLDLAQWGSELRRDAASTGVSPCPMADLYDRAAAERQVERDRPIEPPPPPPLAPFLGPPEEAEPSTFVIVNQRRRPITLVESAETFRLDPGEDGPSDEPDSMRIGGFGPLIDGPSCACRCGQECLVCEPPRLETRRIAPGESLERSYSGRVRVWARGCFEPYALPEGTRRFTACLEGAHQPDGDCVSVEVEYPVGRVEFVFR